LAAPPVFLAVDFAVPLVFRAAGLTVPVALATVSFAAATTALAVLAAVAITASAGLLLSCFLAAILRSSLARKVLTVAYVATEIAQMETPENNSSLSSGATREFPRAATNANPLPSKEVRPVLATIPP
jgi:hypothetical protein